MSLLDVIPFSLFRMLSSPAHVRNVAVLEGIFEQFFDDFAFAPKRAEVLQVIQEVLDNPDYRTLPDEDVADAPAETAQHIIYGRLRDDGWIMEVANRRNMKCTCRGRRTRPLRPDHAQRGIESRYIR